MLARIESKGGPKIKNKNLLKVLANITKAIEQDKNIFRHLQALKEAIKPEDEMVLNDIRERYKIDSFVHMTTNGSHSNNSKVENTDFEESTGKMTMVLMCGRVIRKRMANFTQYARPLITKALREDDVIIQAVLMMDHAEEILFAECVSEID